MGQPTFQVQAVAAGAAGRARLVPIAAASEQRLKRLLRPCARLLRTAQPGHLGTQGGHQLAVVPGIAACIVQG